MAIKPFNPKMIHGLNTVNLRDLYSNLSRFTFNDNNHIDLTIFNNAELIGGEIKRLYNYNLFTLKVDVNDLTYFFKPFKTDNELKELI